MIEENKSDLILEGNDLQNQVEMIVQGNEKQIIQNNQDNKNSSNKEKENIKQQEVIEKEKTPQEIEKEQIKKGKKNDNFIILNKEQQQQKGTHAQKYHRKIKLNSIKNENRILKKRQQLISSDEIFCVRFSNDDKLFAAGCGDGTIQIQDVKTGNIIYKIICAEEETPTTIIRWRPSQYSQLVSNVLVVADSDGILTHWHIPSGYLISQFSEPDNSIFALDFTPDGQYFVTGGKDSEIKIYSENRQELYQVFSKASWQHPGHANRVFSVKCCQNNQPMQLVSGGWDSNLHLWDIRQKKSVACCYGPLVQGDSIDVSQNEIMVGGYRHGEQIVIYDVRNLSKVSSVIWENRADDVQVYCCQFEKFKQGKSIAAASVNVNEMRLFDPVNKYEGISVAEMSVKGCYTLDYGNVSNIIGFGGGDGIAYICDLPNY